ncbi:MAG: SpoIIE family protein phosphatase [Nitrospirales bacterium]
MSFQNLKIGTKLIILTIPIIAVASVMAALTASNRSDANLKEKLAHRAKSLVHQIMADRKYYASVVVPRIKELGGTLGADYARVHGRFPLPATFVREVAQDTAELRNGFTANLISPWPINKNQGARDDFHKVGFAYVQEHPNQPFIETDWLDGKAVMRVLMADFASAPSCVNCHNSHPDSPKRDFKLNDVMGGLEIIMPMDNYLQESRKEWLVNLAGGAGMCALVFVILFISTRQTISRPLAHLEKRMDNFANQSAERTLVRTMQSRGDEVHHLSDALANMQATIMRQHQELQHANATLEQRVIQRTEELRTTMAEKERIGSELRIASDIQHSILPRTFPPFPDRGDFTIYATTLPATEMGGDFYDFFLLDQDHLGLVMADVSGKGVPAAIYMAVCRSLIKATALKGGTPADCLTHVNHLLCPDNDAAMFVTVFYGILNTRSGEFAYSNAGHHLPYLIKYHGSLIVPEPTGGMALGVIEEAAFTSHMVNIHPQDSLFLYTDGVTEAINRHGEFYEESRLELVLTRTQRQSSAEMIQATVDDVRKFAEGTPQADDITALALRYTPQRVL